MLLVLPDQSLVDFEPKARRFRSLPGMPGAQPPTATSPSPAPVGIDAKTLEHILQNPSLPFAECFRRISDHPRYSPIQSRHKFNVSSLTTLYRFPHEYQGGTFCPSNEDWDFLDGGIRSHQGYGWGSHSWTVVEGSEALRAVCLFCAIKQPVRIKGEGPRRPLSLLLQDISASPLVPKR